MHHHKLAGWLLGSLMVFHLPAIAQSRGQNTFNTRFQADATGRSDINAYLLGFLSTVIYPKGLDEYAGGNLNEQLLHKSPTLFEAKFIAETKHLFMPLTGGTPPDYEFIYRENADGYDPEAMVIGYENAVFVVFRGTDQVGRESSLMEWMQTDFSFWGIQPGDGLRGKVHSGFWNSLSIIKERTALQVLAFGGARKKVWITGHSLGGAHAQLFAMYLYKVHRLKAQGVYTFASPHVGDGDFVSEMDGAFEQGNRLQRFEFMDDPATLMPAYAMGYSRGGTRNFYRHLDGYDFNTTERTFVGDGNLLPAFASMGPNLLQEQINSKTPVKISTGFGGFCYHHPEWYLAAAYKTLNRIERTGVPLPLALPGQFSTACNSWEIAKANTTSILPDPEKVAEAISYNVSQIFKNIAGTALEEGTYFIRCYSGRKYLDVSAGCNGEDGCKVQLWSLGKSEANNKFDIKRAGVGYTIKCNGKFLEVDGDDMLENNARVQMWTWGYIQDGNPLQPGIQADLNPLMEGMQAFRINTPNQKWMFFKIPGQSNAYLIRNVGSLKVLDANNKCVTENGCKVKQYDAIDGDATQVWILEKER